ncbi:unnamed protein product [Knipowitschia caucasica]
MRMAGDGQVPAPRGAAAGEEPLPGVQRMAAWKPAVDIRKVFMAHFSEEGALPWQPTE